LPSASSKPLIPAMFSSFKFSSIVLKCNDLEN
jgi:hypothetical protein